MARNRSHAFIASLAFAAAMSIAAPRAASCQEAQSKSEQGANEIETEHIFGFTEGTDIGELGEREIESTTVTTFGKIGRYANVSNETAFRDVVTEHLRLSVGTLTDFYAIHGVPDLASRTSFGLSGLDAEARLVVIDHHQAPFGMDIGINPQWRRLDDVSGAATQSFSLPMVVALDKEIIAETLYGGINMTYTPSLARLTSSWQHEDTTEVSAAISGVVAPNILFGGEIRHVSLADGGTFKSHAIFIGPSFYARIAHNMEAKIAWSTQVTDFAKTNLDLDNFARHQVILLLSYTF